jgi:hypothetical protein
MSERGPITIVIIIIGILGVFAAFIIMTSPVPAEPPAPPSGQASEEGSLSDGLIFTEDFDSGLTRWELIGYPRPDIAMNQGTPAPSFDNRGDDLYDNMAVSRATFSYSEGLIIAFDMFLNDSLAEGCWVDGLVRIPRTEGGSGAAVQISHRVIGGACWDNPAEEQMHGVRDFGITNSSGGYEWYTEIGGDADEDLGEWHHYAIVIIPDHHVEFYVDGTLRYRTKDTMNQSYQDLPLAIGSRSHPVFGPALIDSIRVYRYEEYSEAIFS